MSIVHGSVAGRVIDAAGAPVAGASVMVVASPRRHSDIAAITDADGRFRFSRLDPGHYGFAVHASGHRPGSVAANVTSGDETDVELRLHD